MCNPEEQAAHGRILLQSMMTPRSKNRVQSEGEPQQGNKLIKEHTGLLHLRAGGQQQPAGWFGGFSEHESTYTQDAVEVSGDWPERSATLLPEKLYPGEGRVGRIEKKGAQAKEPEWFEESPSGGPNAAWQTYYPSLDDFGHFGSGLQWMYASDGRWQQVYEAPSSVSTATNSLAKAAGWFDTHVMNYDALGRVNEPASRTRMYIDWEPKLSKLAINCNTPGCIANASMQVYEPGKKAKCVMTYATHPTDFDDDHSEEIYEYISVNGFHVNTYCKPRATGCGPKAVSKTALYPCMMSQDISELLSQNNGTLNMSAKISDMVDECPLDDGSLLSGAAEIYCLIQKPPETVTPVIRQTGVNAVAPLQCEEPGCIANATLYLSDVENLTCRMKVEVNQTDFDKALGSVEQVEWIKVGDQEIKANCTPGKNPCKNATSLANVDHESFDCISGVNVTADAHSGMVNVSAKISSKVDECASQGFLLDGLVTITCRPRGAATTDGTEAATPAAAATPAPAPAT
jgi:hypothetical protein